MNKVLTLVNRIFPYSWLHWLERAICRLIGKMFETFVVRYRGYSVSLPASDLSAAQIYFRYLLTKSWRHEMYEQMVVEDLLTNKMKGAYFIDGGASYGMYSLLAASLPSVEKVFAIEASPKTFTFLENTVKANRLESRLYCINAAICAQSDAVRYVLENSNTSEWCHTTDVLPIESEHLVSTVPGISLDDLIVDQCIPLDSPVFIKLDIEGNEPEAFHGLRRLFASNRNYIILFEFHVGILDSCEGGAWQFAREIFDIRPSAIYEVYCKDKKLLEISSFGDFENLIKKYGNNEFPNNLTNILLCKSPIF